MPEVFVSIGSNLDRELHVRGSLADLRTAFGALRCSSVYQTRAVGFDGDDFYNLVVAFHTDATPRDVLQRLKAIEGRHGRHRGEARYAPRTLDLDLLLYGDRIVDDGDLQLPRDEIDRYAFVLCPLAELAPALRYPGREERIGELWARFPSNRDELHVIDFEHLPCDG